MMYFIFKFGCALLGAILNVVTIGTFGNIIMFKEPDYDELYENAAQSWNISTNAYKWICAIFNTLTFGIVNSLFEMLLITCEIITEYKEWKLLEKSLERTEA